MKKQLVKSILAAAIVLAAPAISSATTYTWADAVEYWSIGTNGGVAVDRSTESFALGAPNSTFLSLGLGGYAIFSFGINFLDESSVIEVTWGDVTKWEESAEIYVSSTLDTDITAATWTYVADVDNQSGPITVAIPTGSWTYLAILDTSSDVVGEYRDGFDVNAVGVIPVPEPGTMMLFGAGIAGLAAISRRRK